MSRNLILEVKLWEKPFSANKMHYAKFKRDTKAYRDYKDMIMDRIGGDYKIPKDRMLKLSLVTGYSSKLSDLDNAFKPLLDSMQRAMGFDDRQIFEIHALKQHTKKGEEFLMIRLEYLPKTGVMNRIKKMFKNLIGENK